MGVALSQHEPAPHDRILAGKYRLIRPLGEGGMAAVWQAEHLTLDSLVAIKLLDPEIATSSINLERFLREARAAATLRSPHVVQVLDHGVDDGTPYIVMEQLEGESLGDRLDRCTKLPLHDTARIVTHIARALARAHAAGIVHRDLKPDNVFLVNNDDEEIAKLLDFGIAKSLHESKRSAQNSTIPGVLVGTPYYMSPEQAEGASTLDHRTDIWALGVIAFECLLGLRPFEGSTIPSLLIRIREEPQPIPSHVGPVPSGFDAWFAKACARDMGERFASAKLAASELRRLCLSDSAPTAAINAEGVTLVSAALSAPIATNSRSRRLPWSLALGVALALCVVALGAQLLTRHASKPASASAAQGLVIPVAARIPVATPMASDSLPNPSPPAAPSVTLQPETAPPRAVKPRPLGSPRSSVHPPTSTPSPPRASATQPPPKEIPSSARTGIDLGI